MVDQPEPADPEWLRQIEETFGQYQLVAMTATGARRVVCQMQVEQESLAYLRQFPSPKARDSQEALEPLLDEKPEPLFRVRCDKKLRLWTSASLAGTEIPPEIKEVFRKVGSGCFAVETSEGIIFLAAGSDADIEGFANKPVLSQWQLVEMATAPLILLHLTILDRPRNPYRFETFGYIPEKLDSVVL